jgi:serine protease Do
MKNNILSLWQNSVKIILITTYIFINSSIAMAASYTPDNFADLVDQSMHAVVNISTTQKITTSNNKNMQIPEAFPFDNFGDLLEKFGVLPPGFEGEERNKERKAVSLGSGFIIDEDGYIATNNHVITDAEEISIRLSNDKEYIAKVIGYDIKTDLALLKVDADVKFPYVKFGDSEKARVGEWVIAIGNPFGLGGTVTAGIISSRSRDINAGGLVDNYIQTDAAINRGSSGGPMFNNKGEVIGINTAIITPSFGNVGIGFATPASLAKTVLEQLRNSGKVDRAWLGVKIQHFDDEIIESLGLKDNKGALVAEVTKDSPAFKAGIQPGDIILIFDGKEITNERKLPRIVAETPIGKKVQITYLRKNAKHTADATLAELSDRSSATNAKDLSESKVDEDKISKNLFGLYMTKLTSELREKFNIEQDVTGVLIIKSSIKGLWIKRGIQKGDVITAVNQEQVTSVEDVEKLVKQAEKQNRKSVLVLINRNGELVFMPLPIKISE